MEKVKIKMVLILNCLSCKFQNIKIKTIFNLETVIEENGQF